MAESKYIQDPSGTGQIGSYEERWSNPGVLPPGASFYWRMQPPMTNVTRLPDVDGSPKMNSISPAPRLEPMKDPFSDTILGAIDHQSEERPSTHLNIRDNHHWTESPISSRGEVPLISLKEYRVLQNAGINQILQNMAAAVSNIDEMSADILNLIKSFSGDGGLAQGFQSLVNAGVDRINQAAKDGMVVAPEKEVGPADPMNVYKSFYNRKATGFKYTFPYMENMQFSATGGFTDEPDMTGVMGFLGDIAEIGMQMSQSMNLRKALQPGRMIDMPKNYNFTGRERSYTIKFPLFNTKNYNEIIKNWQFLFLLAYQNTPNRISKDLIAPPCQYEAYIPGVWYSKYCTITNMTVDFRGARREMEIPIPFLDVPTDGGGDAWLLQKRTLYTIIPDAFDVSITLTEIVGETQNTMYHMLTESMGQKIRTGTTR